MKQKKNAQTKNTKPSVNLILLQFCLVTLGYPFLLLCKRVTSDRKELF